MLRQPTGIGVYAYAVLPALQELPHVLIPGGDEGTAKQRLKRLLWTQLELPRLAKRHKAQGLTDLHPSAGGLPGTPVHPAGGDGARPAADQSSGAVVSKPVFPQLGPAPPAELPARAHQLPVHGPGDPALHWIA